MKQTCISFFIILTGMIFFVRADAQNSSSDSTIYTSSVKNVTNFYKNTIGKNLELYNGDEYFPAGHNAAGFPYFLSDSMIEGSIWYNGNAYHDIPMHYDLVSDAVIIYDYTRNFFIKLLKVKTDSFSLNNHLFVTIAPGKSDPSELIPGFYEKLYNGNINVYAKREKELKLSANAEDTKPKYVQYDTYFIEMAHIFYMIDNQKTLLVLLKDKGTELKKFIRQNKLNFKKNFENALIKTVEYYTRLKN